MDIGMLWFDKDPSTSFPNKVKRGCAYYQEKYGKAPNICFVHPVTVQDGGGRNGETEFKVEDVLVQVNERVLPHHFWIGVSNGKN
ncbi:MAG: hypothetical protein R6U57_07275 [Anaerolineales bacterium]